MVKLKSDKSIPLKIIYEDGDVVVINKQPDISVHPSINEPGGTLVNALIARYPGLRGIGEDPLRPGIIHRLDKDTSGILVVAKNQKTFDFLKKEWQSGRVIKKYFALVWGRFDKTNGEIKSELARSTKDFRKRMIVRPEKNKSKKITGKLAITEYKVIKKYQNFSLIEVYPKTGRTHQIRIHMASIGHPIVGDEVYGAKKELPGGLKRQFLHANYLSFSLFNKKMAFEADIPEDLEQVLAKLGKE